MKKILILVLGLVFSINLLGVTKIAASDYTYDQCMLDCKLAGRTNCASACSLIAPDTTACGLLGCNLLGLDISRFDNINVFGIITLISSLIFVGIIALGVLYVIKGSLKIIRSEGDASRVEEGTKIFRGIFIGIVMIFVGILGVVLMLALFNAGGVTQVNPELPPLN